MLMAAEKRDGTRSRTYHWCFSDCLSTKPKGKIKLEISGIKKGKHTLTLHRVGYMKNDAYTPYLKMKYDGTLSQKQVRQLKDASSGRPEYVKTVSIAGNKPFRMDFSIRENDVFLITIEK